MDHIICLSSSSSEESFNSLEDQDIDMMPSSYFSQSMLSKSPATSLSPNPNSSVLSKVASNLTNRSTSYNQKRALTGQNEANSCSIERAKKIQANLDPELPKVFKCLHPSHVGDKCRLALPSEFCKSHLPRQSIMMTLIDENQKEFPVKYYVGKKSLTAGWKDFTTAHELVKGDALVLQLVKPTMFKAYVVKSYGMAEENTNARRKQIESCKRMKTSERTADRYQKTLPSYFHKQPGERKLSICASEEVGSVVLGSIGFSGTSVEFNDIKSLEDFAISLNGLILDSNFSPRERREYYKLCCSQKAFLHENLLDTTNSTLASGLISQTINIAEQIRASEISTPREQFEGWDKTLGGLERFGMNVRFLRARIKELVRLLCESEEGVDFMRYREAITRRDDLKVEIETIKAKLFELEETCKRRETEIEKLELMDEHNEVKFQAEVNAPW